MFDASFQVSEKYFSALQMLRIFRSWIQDTTGDFDKFKSELVRNAISLQTGFPYANKLDIDWEIVAQNADTVKERLDALADSLLHRIENKREELESLRDGVSPHLSRYF
jgi:hypothetical protein